MAGVLPTFSYEYNLYKCRNESQLALLQQSSTSLEPDLKIVDIDDANMVAMILLVHAAISRLLCHALRPSYVCKL